MVRKGVKMTFKPNELKFFLFRKKVCPKCHNKLKRYTKKICVGQEYTVSSGKVEMYEFKNFYHCNCCNSEFSLSELAKGGKHEC